MRKTLRKLVVATASLAVAGGASLAVGAPAIAAETAAVPSCVRAFTTEDPATLTVLVRNDCDLPVRVRVNFEPGPSSPCVTVPPRFSHTETRNKPVRFANLTSC